MSRTDPQFNLRIPAELKGRIEEAAQQNKRSATAEIIARLEASFGISEAHEPSPATDVEAQLTNILGPALMKFIKLNVSFPAASEATDSTASPAQVDKVESRAHKLTGRRPIRHRN